MTCSANAVWLSSELKYISPSLAASIQNLYLPLWNALINPCTRVTTFFPSYISLKDSSSWNSTTIFKWNTLNFLLHYPFLVINISKSYQLSDLIMVLSYPLCWKVAFRWRLKTEVPCNLNECLFQSRLPSSVCMDSVGLDNYTPIVSFTELHSGCSMVSEDGCLVFSEGGTWGGHSSAAFSCAFKCLNVITCKKYKFKDK